MDINGFFVRYMFFTLVLPVASFALGILHGLYEELPEYQIIFSALIIIYSWIHIALLYLSIYILSKEINLQQFLYGRQERSIYLFIIRWIMPIILQVLLWIPKMISGPDYRQNCITVSWIFVFYTCLFMPVTYPLYNSLVK